MPNSSTDGAEGEDLGKPVAWQIRDIPERIRDAVVDQARAEKINVAELVTRLVLDARAAGWSFAASSTRFANPSAPARVRAVFAMVGDMGRAGVPVQKGVAALLNRVVKGELRAIVPHPEKTSPGTRFLLAPDSEAGEPPP